MPKVKMVRQFNYTVDQLYALAMDVDNYPEFLPGCQKIRVFNKQADCFDADMVVGYKNFREKFTTRVSYSQNEWVRVTYLKGPMKHLNNSWSFRSINDGNGTEITFDIDLELKNFFLNKMLNGVFDKATEAMITAFEKRAAKIYGVN